MPKPRSVCETAEGSPSLFIDALQQLNQQGKLRCHAAAQAARKLTLAKAICLERLTWARPSDQLGKSYAVFRFTLSYQQD